MRWNILSSETRFQGFLRLDAVELTHETFAGGDDLRIHRECLDRKHAVGVLAFDPLRDELVMIEQFRIGPALNGDADPWQLEIIAGYTEPGESAEEVIHREALEEANIEIQDPVAIHEYYSSPGSSTETIKVYAAKTDTSSAGGVHGLDTEGEDIKVHVLKTAEAFELLDQGKVRSAMPIIALQWFRANRASLVSRWAG